MIKAIHSYINVRADNRALDLLARYQGYVYRCQRHLFTDLFFRFVWNLVVFNAIDAYVIKMQSVSASLAFVMMFYVAGAIYVNKRLIALAKSEWPHGIQL